MEGVAYMTLGLAATLILVGVAGAFLSGMLGIGGAIVNYPMLLYIPVLVGVADFSPHQVAGIVAVQVFFATLAGVVALRKQKLIHMKLVSYMGIAIIIGSFAGGYGGKFLPGSTINLVYGILATIAAIMMFVPKRGLDDLPIEKVEFNRLIAVISALIVGVASGIVGAGGAFILVPIMLLILKIPTRVTIASSLMAGQIPFWPSVVVVVASIVAAPIGVRLGKWVNTKVLRTILAVLIVVTTVKIWSGIL
jgi:uncharacterized membrane protein YfcA